jgi:hypothetical protein
MTDADVPSAAEKTGSRIAVRVNSQNPVVDGAGFNRQTFLHEFRPATGLEPGKGNKAKNQEGQRLIFLPHGAP